MFCYQSGLLFCLIIHVQNPRTFMTRDEYLFKIRFAKKAITWKWLRPNPPTKDDWVAVVNKINCREKPAFNLRCWENMTIYAGYNLAIKTTIKLYVN